MAKNAKLAALRSTAASSDKQPKAPRVLPDLSKPETEAHPMPMTAQSHAAYAQTLATMAIAPDMPSTVSNDQEANAWFAGLTQQEQAAYVFEQEVETSLAAADTVSTIPLRWYFKLLPIYTVGDECKLDDFPIPDSDKGNNPAKRKEPGRNKAGKPATIEVDFYDVFARNLHEGKLLRAEIESLQAAAPKSGASMDKIKPEHRMLTDDQRQSRLETAVRRWSRFRTSLKDAIWIRVQWAAIKNLPGVELDYVYDVEYDDKGQEVSRAVTTSSTPFAIWAKGNDALKFTYTVANFLKLKPEWAKDHGGTLKALREGPPAEAKTPTEKQKVLTVTTIESTFAETASFFGDAKLAAALLTKACAAQGSSEALSDDYVLSLGRTILGLDTIWKHIKDRYLGLTIKQEQANKQAALQQAENIGA